MTRLAAGLVSAAVILAGLYYGRHILIPLAVALLVGFTLNIPVQWLTRLGLPRALSTSLVMLSLLVVLSGLAGLLSLQVRSLALEFPNYQATMLNKLSRLREEINAPGVLDRVQKTVERLQQEVAEVAKDSAEGPLPPKIEIVPPSSTPLEETLAWIGRVSEPLAMAGIVFIFAFLMLLDRSDLRDRLLRLFGNNLYRSTQSIEEASRRLSRYLLMQLLVNVSYGVPMGLGLWIIGVPGALLWGVVATVMRFVPYIGPMISAVFPLALAFAVDDGWSMIVWTLGLILVLELISNNIVEPLLYGSSTGISTISLIASAMFWTALWGPIGLILSTPITVCLLVLGRNIPQLQFLDILLGSTPVLDLPTRLYQRLIADDLEEAIEIADAEIEKESVENFYHHTGIAILQIASQDYSVSATVEHRQRLLNGMDALLEYLRDAYPAGASRADHERRIVCIGGKWEIDTYAAQMLAHTLALAGIDAEALPTVTISAHYVANLDLRGNEIVCLSYFNPNPTLLIRHFVKRLRMRWPDLRIVVAAWNAPEELLANDAGDRLQVAAVATSIQETLGRIQRMITPDMADRAASGREPTDERAKIDALQESGLLEAINPEKLDVVCKQVKEIFDTDAALISVIHQGKEQYWGQSGEAPASIADEKGRLSAAPLEDAISRHVVSTGQTLVVFDIEREPRFADHQRLKRWAMRFYAAAPLRLSEDVVIGALVILDADRRLFGETERKSLERIAAEILASLQEDAKPRAPAAAENTSSTTLGQRVPD